MCYQCVSKSKTIKENVIGEYSLQIAKESAYDYENKIVWQENCYALVFSNDPDVYFNDIVFGIDEEKNEEQYDLECEKIEKLLDKLTFHHSLRLSENLLAIKYDETVDDMPCYYIYDIISEALKEK